jgi:transcriptional regulator with XRE-family HTH domain
MGKATARRVIVPRWRPLPYSLPELPRRRPRSYEEWSALRRWGKLPREETTVAGFLLREARESAGLSQAELARRLGRSQQAISQAERWNSNPTVALLVEWAGAVGRRLRLEMPERAVAQEAAEGRRAERRRTLRRAIDQLEGNDAAAEIRNPKAQATGRGSSAR